MLAEYYYCSFSLSKMDFLKDLKRFLHPIQLCSIMCNYARLETQGSRPEAFGLFQYVKRFIHPIQLCSIMCNYARLETQGSWPEAFGLFQYIKLVSTSLPGRILSYGSRIWYFRIVLEPQSWKNRPLRKTYST